MNLVAPYLSSEVSGDDRHSEYAQPHSRSEPPHHSDEVIIPVAVKVS